MKDKTVETTIILAILSTTFFGEYIEPTNRKSLKIYQTVWLNKKSYKPIILGKEGKSIKTISVQARQDMESFLKSKVHLFIRLKIKKSG